MTRDESIQVAKDLAELEYWRMVVQGAMDHRSPVDFLSHRERVSELRSRAATAVRGRLPVDEEGT